MAQFTSASALNWTPYGAEYFNINRGMLDNNTEVLSSDFISCPALSGVKDVKINHQTIFYLTDKKFTKDVFTNESATTAFHLSSLPLSSESIVLGTSGVSNFVDYYFCASTPQYNKTVEINSATTTSLNYLLTVPFKTNSRENENNLKVFQFNIMNLKNTMTPWYEYDKSISTSIRDYNKIFIGANQKHGFDNLFLNYSSNLYQFKFNENDTTYFIYPYDSESSYLSSSNLINRGAKPGNSPMNSDIISMDVTKAPENYNGQFLCSWLSGSNDCSCNSIWMERWFDPNSVTQGDAYITGVNSGSSCKHIWDIPSDMKLIPKVRYYYDRYGKDRNDIVVDSLSGLIAKYDTWTESLSDSSGYSNNGYILESYSGSESELELDGKTHAHIYPTDMLLSERELTVGLLAYKDNWCCGKNSQIFGNYRFGGWGIFYNTGIPNNIITLGDDFGNVFSFNIDGTRIFEKEVDKDDTINNFKVSWIASDLTGARWILDGFNNKIFKIDVDDLMVEILNLPPSYELYKIQIDPSNRIYIHDKTNNKIFIHDELGNYVDSVSSPTSAVNFELDQNGDIVYSEGDIMTINSEGIVYKTLGSNLYKDDEIIYHFKSRIMDLKIDSYDNVWIIYSGNKLVKIDSDDKVIFNTEILSFLSTETSSKIGLVRKSNSNGCDEDRLWVVCSDNKTLVEVDKNGSVKNSIDTTEYIITQGCNDYSLFANGDFTGYDINRRYDVVNGNIVSPENPALTLRVKLKTPCNVKLFKQIHIPICNLSSGWHHFSYTFNGNTGKIKLYIDGVVSGSLDLSSNSYSIDYNDTTPFIIGGNSGKLGSENVEKSVIDDQYFIGKVDDVRIYNKELEEFSVKAISDNKFGNYEDLIWNVETSSNSYIEKVDHFFMNKKPGHISKSFNLKINGLDISTDLQLLIEDAISNSITKLIPIHTELNSIVWN